MCVVSYYLFRVQSYQFYTHTHFNFYKRLAGIQPNVERLTRKHKEQCEDIKSKTQYAKQKLELHCDNDLSDRIQEYQRKEESNSSIVTQHNEFANRLLQEQNEHSINVTKLKEKLLQEEENIKAIYSLQLQTLAKDNSVVKIRSSKSQHLQQQLLRKKEKKQHELDSKLERVGKDFIKLKAQWEESWNKASALRLEKKINTNKEKLLQWRKAEVEGIVRRNIIADENCSSSEDDDNTELAKAHDNDIVELNGEITKQHANSEDVKAKLCNIAKRTSKITCKIREVQDEMSEIKDKLKDIDCKIERTRKQHDQSVREAHDHTTNTLRSITKRMDEVEQEIVRCKEDHRKELA